MLSCVYTGEKPYFSFSIFLFVKIEYGKTTLYRILAIWLYCVLWIYLLDLKDQMNGHIHSFKTLKYYRI